MQRSTKAGRPSATRRAQRRPQLWLTVGGGLGIVVLVAVSWFTLSDQTAVPTPAAGSGVTLASAAPASGNAPTAPDFTVPTLEGGTFTLSAQRGKPVILFIMAYWCGTCIPEAQALGKLHQQYGERLAILALDVDPSSTPEGLRKFRQYAGAPNYVWAFDRDNQVVQAYRIRALDTTFIINQTGEIVYSDAYPTSYGTLAAQITKLLG
jgi:peroxiredoxin